MATAFALPPVEAMTSRLVVMMTSADKRSLEERARASGLTPSEFARRAIEQYEPRVDDRVLDAFLTEFEANNRTMAAKLRATNDRLDATLAAIDARHASREAELQALRAKYAAE